MACQSSLLCIIEDVEKEFGFILKEKQKEVC